MRRTTPRLQYLPRDTSGSAALEFSIAGLVIMMLLFVIFDIGVLFMDQRGLDYSVYRAARWASVNSASLTTSAVLAQFQAAAAPTLGASTTNACTGYSSAADVPNGTTCYVVVSTPGGATFNNPVTVQASFAWSPFSLFTGLTAVTLSSSTTLTIQN
jgi:Flp pilus assembly protein TadG